LNLDHLHGIALALTIGLLVGLERGWTLRQQGDGARFAGIRTFALFGLAGGVAGALHAQAKGPATILVGAAAALVLFGYHRATRQSTAMSGTSSMVGLLTIASGFFAANGQPVLGSTIAVIMVLLLSQRKRLHGWVSHLHEGDVVAVARMALISLVILPLLPDRNMGPYDAWNPQALWLVVVLVSGLSFAGYCATRLLGPERGLLATAAAGSVVSSTAVTAAFALRMRQEEAERPLLVAGIALASGGHDYTRSGIGWCSGALCLAGSCPDHAARPADQHHCHDLAACFHAPHALRAGTGNGGWCAVRPTAAAQPL